MRAFAVVAASLLAAGSALAQQPPDPFTLPPPTQRPAPPGQPTPAQPQVITMEVLARQGFEVKAIERGSERSNGFLVLMQRAGEIRTCLMRIERAQGQAPRQTSICF
ncbi:MAG: hypothetical protein J0L51_12105 [Rhizobiales bacterium]|nr:hypothetical protein [Hyphomicrobiales bacterium]